MFMTHNNFLCTEEITLIDRVRYPQFVHLVTDGGMQILKGFRILPIFLLERLCAGEFGADLGTAQAIRDLTQNPEIRAGLIIATGNTNWSGYLSRIRRTEAYPTHKILPLGIGHIAVSGFAQQMGNFDYITTDSSSCISGHSAWHQAKLLIDSNKLDAVVVMATDNAISEEYLHMFADQGISRRQHEEDNPDIVKFRIGQGAHVGIFESNASLFKSGNVPVARIHDVALAAEYSTNPLGINDTGQGYRAVMNAVNLDAIDFVKLHGSHTADNAVEEQVVQELLGEIRRVEYKLRIGHTMGASTAVETGLAIREEAGRFLSLGAGMGNVFSAAVVEIL